MSTTNNETRDQLRQTPKMTEANTRRRFAVSPVNQTTGDTGDPEVFTFETLAQQINEGDADIALEQLIALNIGDSLRFGGGAAPLFDLKRDVDCAADWRVSLRKYRSTWHWFTTNPQGGGFGSSHQGSKRVAHKAAFRCIPAGALVEIITEHDGQQINREIVTA